MGNEVEGDWVKEKPRAGASKEGQGAAGD